MYFKYTHLTIWGVLMSNELRVKIFENYLATQGQSSSFVYKNIKGQWPYYEVNYSQIFSNLDKDSQIFEIGSGPGSLLSWLKMKGFKNLAGAELSPMDAKNSNELLGDDYVSTVDGFKFLKDSKEKYDVVIMKAVLEHQQKSELLDIIETCKNALNPGGMLVIDVPNMDWLLAAHERYMDLTHEVGFTPESLKTLLSLFFNDNKIWGSRTTIKGLKKLVRSLTLCIFKMFLRALGEGASTVKYDSRSIISVSKRN